MPALTTKQVSLRLKAVQNEPTVTKESLMNICTESNHAAGQDNARSLKSIASSAAAWLGVTLVAAGILLAVPCAKAQTKPFMSDNDFILAAGQGGMTEVKLGELAAQKAIREDVRAFGQMMVKDHMTINGELKALAVQKAVTLPKSLDTTHQEMVDRMTSLRGSQFDDAYIDIMTTGHKEDVKEFKAESAATQDADIKSFVDKFIPVVEEHLKRITAMK
jgi:putative membrane protein